MINTACKYNKNVVCPFIQECDNECVRELMMKEVIYAFEHGSFVYGTENENSDFDVVYVVSDKFSDFLDQFEQSIFQYNPDEKVDFEYVTESRYIELIKEYDPMAIESLFLPDIRIVQGSPKKYLQYFNKDNWAIRQKFCAVSNNSWAKAHKKMTVKKDFNMYVGQKSLFHSIRLLMFATQLCQYGRINKYGCANYIWRNIINEHTQSWDYYKEKYKPIYNKAHSKLVKVAPKPE